MKLQIVCLRDIKTDAHTVPQFVPHLESWRRALSDAINKPDQRALEMDFVRHPEDFEAYHLGEWDDASAAFSTQFDVPEFAVTPPKKVRIFLLSDLVTPK